MSWGAQHRLFALMAGFVLAVFATILVLREPPAESDAPAPVTGEPGVDVLPERIEELPRTATLAPPVLEPDRPAPPLGDSWPGRALALLQQYRESGDAPVLLLAEDGRLWTVDAFALAPAADADGNQRPVVSGATLTDDGWRAVFPQRDRLVIVDLAQHVAHEVAVPGFNESLRWQRNRLLVNQNDAVTVVGPLPDEVEPASYPFRDLVTPSPSWPDNIAVSLLPADAPRPAVIRLWPSDGVPADMVLTGAAATARWTGFGWAVGDLVARAARLPDRPGFGWVLVVDAESGGTVRALRIPCDAPPLDACARVAGWSSDGRVLVELTGAEHWLLAWNPGAGTLARITQVRGGPVAAVWGPGLTDER